MKELALEGGLPVRTKEKILVFGAPLIEEPEIEEVVGCMRRRWIGTGPKVREFEEDFAAFKGSRHAIALNSCTAAHACAPRGHSGRTNCTIVCGVTNGCYAFLGARGHSYKRRPAGRLRPPTHQKTPSRF